MSINAPQNAPATQVNNRRPAFAPSYNAVQINLDTPTLNAPAPYYYDYPQAEGQPYYPPMTPAPQPAPAPAPAPQAPQDTNVPKPQVEQPKPADAPAETKPAENAIDMDKVIANLSSKDFDQQAIQMDEIAKKGLADEADAVPYVQEDVFNKLSDIVNFDSTGLEGPTPEQIEIRAKAAENAMALIQAQKEGKDPASVKLPHQLSPEAVAAAEKITPFEQAERNKEYALFTMAILQKTYGDEIEKRSGNVVPLTDLPGAAQVVNELKGNENPAIRTAAIDSLRYIQRPEYKEDLSKIYSIAQTDADEGVAAAAADALNSLNQ
ncbi:MAG: hypothetical protein K6E29_02235 [Cyanobacteria bacterium RUI128]|nr:hypothetical protein [Cyanobacteria bacterium RUI128]